jgi:hypothetical protein
LQFSGTFQENLRPCEDAQVCYFWLAQNWNDLWVLSSFCFFILFLFSTELIIFMPWQALRSGQQVRLQNKISRVRIPPGR